MRFNEHIKKELINEYAGSERKKTVLLDDGHKYLLKFPDPVRESRNELSYINNAISEYIGCKVTKALGLPVQEVILGEYMDERGRIKVACACQDVRGKGEIMHPVQTINLSSLDDTTRNDASIRNAMVFADRLGLIPQDVIKMFYYDMFVADALLGNTDRHNGNWAVLTDEQGNARMSPIYDCGSSLSPLLGDEDLDYRHLSSDAMNTFSVILDDNHRRINYKDYLLSCQNHDLNDAVKRVVGRIDMCEIYHIVDDIQYISEKRKHFYKDIMTMRYEKILLPTLQKILQRNKEDVDHETAWCTAKSLKDFSENVLTEFRRIEPYTMAYFKIDGSKDIIAVRKASSKFAIFYDKDMDVAGVAPIGKDYQDVKAFIFEMSHILQLQKQEQYKCIDGEDEGLHARKDMETPYFNNHSTAELDVDDLDL